MIDGSSPQCKFRRKKYYVENQDRLLNKQKFYNKENRDHTKEYQLKNHDKIKNYKKTIFSTKQD